MIRCRKCRSRRVVKAGFRTVIGGSLQRYQCQKCGHVFAPKGRQTVQGILDAGE